MTINGTDEEIDDELVEAAIAANGGGSVEAAVEAALTMFVRVKGQGAMRELRGKVEWEGDLEQSRLGRFA